MNLNVNIINFSEYNIATPVVDHLSAILGTNINVTRDMTLTDMLNVMQSDNNFQPIMNKFFELSKPYKIICLPNNFSFLFLIGVAISKNPITCKDKLFLINRTEQEVDLITVPTSNIFESTTTEMLNSDIPKTMFLIDAPITKIYNN